MKFHIYKASNYKGRASYGYDDEEDKADFLAAKPCEQAETTLVRDNLFEACLVWTVSVDMLPAIFAIATRVILNQEEDDTGLPTFVIYDDYVE